MPIEQSGFSKKILATGRFWRKAAVHLWRYEVPLLGARCNSSKTGAARYESDRS
jgi:hypothetical protein